MAVMLSDLLRNLTFNRSAHCTQVSDQCPLGLLFVLIIQENKEQVINDDREISRNFLTIIFNPLLKVFALLKQIIYAFIINEIKYSLVCLKR